MITKIKTATEIADMRVSGNLLAQVLAYIKPLVVPGSTTKEIADQANAKLFDLEPTAKHAFLGYQDFPDVICISVNDEVVHGIPGDRIINDGDIVGLDYGVSYNGMITDAAISVIAGRAKQKGHIDLLARTEAALDAGIFAVIDQVRTGTIGAAVEASLSRYPYGIVKDLVGHGVGHHVHEDPNIPNYGRANTGPWLDAGMTIAIEPMVTLGTDQVHVADDGWTILTNDGSMAAHFEHTVLITAEGAEILTQV